MDELNTERLRDLANDNLMRRILEIIKSRQRGRAETSIEKVQDWVVETDATANGRRQALILLRALEKANAGRLILGRGGKKTRFKWYFDMRDIATRALQFNDTEGIGKQKDSVEDRPGMKRFVFPLRKDQDLAIDVPSDLKAEERDRLADFIRILPV